MVDIGYLVSWLVSVTIFLKHTCLPFICCVSSSKAHWPSFKKCKICILDGHIYESEDFILDMFTIKDNSAEFQLSEHQGSIHKFNSVFEDKLRILDKASFSLVQFVFWSWP